MTTHITEEHARERERAAFFAGYSRGVSDCEHGEVTSPDNAASVFMRRERAMQELADLGQQWEKE